jgi:hypothetical protein
MAKIRIQAPRNLALSPKLDILESLGNLNKSSAKNAPGKPTPAVSDTIGVSDDTKTKEYADWRLVGLSYVLLVLGVWLGNLLASKATGVTFTASQDTLGTIGFLALFFVMAEAMERLMEPVAELNLRFIGSARIGKQNQQDKDAKAAEDSADPSTRNEKATAAANSAAEANGIAANTKVFIWALASFIAMLASGATKVYFLQAIGFNGIPDYLNVLITGLVIGGGTKPLHDLITLIEKKSDTASAKADDGNGNG